MLSLAACSIERHSAEPPEEREVTPPLSKEPAPTAAEAPPSAALARERPWPAAPASPDVAGDRVFSKVRFLWIRPKPDENAEWIGYLSMGDDAPLLGGTKESADAGPGSSDRCRRWYAVAPRGFVCAGADATLDADDPDVVELRKRRARHEPLPYAYGESLGTTVYIDIPPRKRQYFRESAFHEHMAEVALARGAATPEEVARVAPRLAGVDLAPTGNPPPPRLLHLGARSLPQMAAGKYGFPEVVGGSTIAYTYSFDADERTWVMTWDRGIVPKDRLRVFPASSFHGLPLGDGVSLPLAFFRAEAPKLERSGDGVATTGQTWARYDWVGLTGEALEVGGKRYLVTREEGRLVEAALVSAPEPRSDLPSAVRAGTSRTWLDVSILGGWLVAYEGKQPVYATMISPGRGGLPKEGKTLLETASTPVGDFPISGKFHTATMTSNYSEKVVHAEVPYTQNFSGPYALHAAYWHDDWGVGKSGGCVNLSPIDAMRIFAWTEPRLPEGWHGMRAIGSDAAAYAAATVVSTHR